MQQKRLRDAVAHHLRELGCSEEQIRRHVLRGKIPRPITRLRPRPYKWLSWSTRIMNFRHPRMPGGLK